MDAAAITKEKSLLKTFFTVLLYTNQRASVDLLNTFKFNYTRHMAVLTCM